MPDVKKERSGWRDMELSQRHRMWGWDCPAVDLDFLLIEYDKGKVAALVEYKHETAKLQYSSHPTYKALIDLGNRADLPVFVCRYSDDFTRYKAIPLNRIAKKILKDVKVMSEKEWVSFLYRIRGRKMPKEISDVLNGLYVEI